MEAEERLRTAIRRLEADLVSRIQSTSDAGKEDIEKWVTEYIAALHVEMPLSVKQVLDRGGAVRSLMFNGISSNHPLLEVRLDGQGHQIYLQEMDFQPKGGKLPSARITCIVEPIEAS